MRVVFATAFAFAAALTTAGCVGVEPAASDGSGSGGNGATQDSTADAGVSADLAPPADLTPHPLPADLGSTDLAGLVSCFGMAVCEGGDCFVHDLQERFGCRPHSFAVALSDDARKLGPYAASRGQVEVDGAPNGHS